jgi:hypothetical protein
MLTAESMRLFVGESLECPLVKFHFRHISDKVAEECGGKKSSWSWSCGKKRHVDIL